MDEECGLGACFLDNREEPRLGLGLPAGPDCPGILGKSLNVSEPQFPYL